MPSYFRTYEAQSRLLAAVIASNPSMKLNFKAIAQHYGSDVTTWGIEHRFRPIKKQASIIREAVAAKKDPKDMVSIFHLNDKDIAKYYGESTPQGIEFQFRAIKKDAKALREAIDKGANPLATRKNVPAGVERAQVGSGRHRHPLLQPGVAGAESLAPPPPAKRSRAAELVSSNEEDEGCSTLASDDVDYEQLDLTPVQTPTHRMASTKAAAQQPSVMTSADNGLAPITPSTTMAPDTSTSFIPDVTPALSTGVSPPEHESPENAELFHTAMQQQRTQPAFHPKQPAGMNQTFYGVIDDDEGADDDDVFIIDTPSKMPKMEPSTSASTTTLPLALGGGSDFDSWDSLGQKQLQHYNSQSQNISQNHSQSQTHFSFDTSSSSWAQPEFFPSATGHITSFVSSGSFYDNDGAI